MTETGPPRCALCRVYVRSDKAPELLRYNTGLDDLICENRRACLNRRRLTAFLSRLRRAA